MSFAAEGPAKPANYKRAASVIDRVPDQTRAPLTTARWVGDDPRRGEAPRIFPGYHLSPIEDLGPQLPALRGLFPDVGWSTIPFHGTWLTAQIVHPRPISMASLPKAT
jgi:hypothetical protein